PLPGGERCLLACLLSFSRRVTTPTSPRRGEVAERSDSDARWVRGLPIPTAASSEPDAFFWCLWGRRYNISVFGRDTRSPASEPFLRSVEAVRCEHTKEQRKSGRFSPSQRR